MYIPATVIGTLNVDINLYVDRISSPGGESKVLNIKRTLGGKGGNIITAFAKLAGGGRFIGAVGNDDAGKLHLDAFKKLNVDSSGVKIVDNVESGQSFVLVDPSGQNQINSYYGANSALDLDLILSQKTSIEKSRFVIAANVDPSLASFAFRMTGGIKAYVPAAFAVRNPESVRKVSGDYIFLNKDEMDSVAGDLAFKGIIVTMGSDGAKIITGNKEFRVPRVDLESFGLKVRNTAGAGDAFTGAFMAALYKGLDDFQALKHANYAAALKVTKDEARGSPTADELAKFLSRSGESAIIWGAVG
ncbi:MAG: PfkB family carbohydrate kinase [Conexivisphaerales archaeon]